MLKSSLITNLGDELNQLSLTTISDSVNTIIDSMTDAIGEGARIEIRGFGSFSLHYRPSRQAHNPKTGKHLITSPSYKAHFKPGKELRERVNED